MEGVVEGVGVVLESFWHTRGECLGGGWPFVEDLAVKALNLI